MNWPWCYLIDNKCSGLSFERFFFFCFEGPNCTEQTAHPPDMTSMTSLTTMPPEETTSQPEMLNYRLPTSLLPVHYTVVLRPDFYSKNVSLFSTPGYVKILINCTENTDNITLHINKITFDNSTVKVYHIHTHTSHSIGVSMVTENKDLQFLIVHTTSMLMAGDMYMLEMNFTAALLDDLAGLYYSTFDRNGTTM
jgi:aminopeptidase N